MPQHQLHAGGGHPAPVSPLFVGDGPEDIAWHDLLVGEGIVAEGAPIPPELRHVLEDELD